MIHLQANVSYFSRIYFFGERAKDFFLIFLGATSQDFSMLPTAIIKRLRLCHALIKQLFTHKKI